jgi:hypothetical protein
MPRTFFVFLLAALCCAACNQSTNNTTASAAASPAASDQSQAPRQRYWVTRTQVKPEMMAQFREFYLKETLPAQQKGGVKQQSVWTSTRLGEAGEYITIRPIDGLQYFDEPNDITKALGEEGFRKWAAKRATMIVSSHGYVTQDWPEISLAPNPNEAPKLSFVVRRTVAPGRRADYENHYKNDILPLIKKASPKGFVVRRVTTGGNTDEVISAVLVDSFADYDKYATTLQKEGYNAAAAKRAGIVTHQESAVYRYVPDLSIRPGTTQAALQPTPKK